MTATSSLLDLLKDRIVVLDGAMGTMIQARGFNEADFRGDRFADSPDDLQGNNDLLTLTQPATIVDIHREFLLAGADIISTNTFNSSAPAQADYGLESLVGELNREAARLARQAADEVAADTGAARYVAGVLWANQSHGFDFSGCQRSSFSQHLLPGTRGHLRAGHCRTTSRWRRCANGGNDF